MKTVYLLFTVIFLALLTNTGIAQNNGKIYPENSVEKKYDKETYVINNDSLSQNTLRSSNGIQRRINTTIENKDEGIFSSGAAGACHGFKETIPLTEVLKQAIPKEKIKSLAFDDKNGIIITYYFDTQTGKVVHLRFLLKGIILSDSMDSKTDITLKDIKKLESLFKEYHFDVSNLYCDEFNHSEVKFGNWYQMFWFSKLLADEGKEK